MGFRASSNLLMKSEGARDLDPAFAVSMALHGSIQPQVPPISKKNVRASGRLKIRMYLLTGWDFQSTTR
jgi:hypothetical protein